MSARSSRSRPVDRPGSSSTRDPRASPAAPPEDKHGIRLSNTAAFFLDDVVVPARQPGRPGRGPRARPGPAGLRLHPGDGRGVRAGRRLGSTRPGHRLLHATAIQGGAPLAQKQGYTHKLIVPHAVRLEAARAFMEETADRLDAGRGADGALNTEGAIAEVPGHRGRQRRGRGGDPGPRRLRLHPALRRREDQAGRPHHHDLRGHLGDPGDDDRPGPVAAAPEDRAAATTATPPRRAPARGPPRGGADAAALALDCLGRRAGRCRTGRLTRNQHVLLRLGELIAYAESAGALAPAGGRGRRRPLPEKADRRFRRRRCGDQPGLRPGGGAEGRRRRHCAGSSGAPTRPRRGARSPPLPRSPVRAAQAGLLTDMDHVADALYARISLRACVVMTAGPAPHRRRRLGAVMPDAPDAATFWGTSRPAAIDQRRAARALGPGALLRPGSPAPDKTYSASAGGSATSRGIRSPGGCRAADDLRADGGGPEVVGGHCPVGPARRRMAGLDGRTRNGSPSSSATPSAVTSSTAPTCGWSSRRSSSGCAARRRSRRCRKGCAPRCWRDPADRSWPACRRSPRTPCPASWPT